VARKLKDIEIDEVSLVDAPANRRKFLIVKKDLGRGAGVGGPRQGIGGARYCVCPECGYAVEHERIGEGKSVPCAEIKCPKCGAKMIGSETKKLEVKKQMEELKKLLEEYLGEEINEKDFKKAEKLSDKALNAIKGALKLISKYKEDFPDDLKKAIGVLAKYAGYGYGYGYPAKKEGIEKVGAKLSKSTIEKIISVIKALNDLLPEENQVKVRKEAMTKDENYKEEIEKIKKNLEQLEVLGELEERIKRLEKARGIKKSIDGDGKERTEKKEFKWTLGKLLDGDEE